MVKLGQRFILPQIIDALKKDIAVAPFLDWSGVTKREVNLHKSDFLPLLFEEPSILYFLPEDVFVNEDMILKLLNIDFNFIFSKQINMVKYYSIPFKWDELSELVIDNIHLFNEKSVTPLYKKIFPLEGGLVNTLISSSKGDIKNIRLFSLFYNTDNNYDNLKDLAVLIEDTEKLKSKGAIEKSVRDYIYEDTDIYSLSGDERSLDNLYAHPILSSVYSLSGLLDSKILRIMQNNHRAIIENYNLSRLGKIDIIGYNHYRKIIEIDPKNQAYLNLFRYYDF